MAGFSRKNVTWPTTGGYWVTVLRLIADIHGNAVALEAALQDVESDSECVVCLGDAVQGGAQPVEVVERLMELSCPVVMGNADSWLLTGRETSTVESVSPEQQAVREWTLSRLDRQHTDFISAFVPTVELELGNRRRLLAFHGSPDSFDHLIFPESPDSEVREVFAQWSADVYAGGHTHIQQIRRVAGSTFVNPGSVGVVHDRSSQDPELRLEAVAEYCQIKSEKGRLSIEFRRVGYDTGELVAAVKKSGRPGGDRFVAQYRL